VNGLRVRKSVGRREIIRQAATRRNAAALRAADGLARAGAPTFAIMALLTGALGGGPGGDALPTRARARSSAMKSGRECLELATFRKK
jgi:hypothetical protein